MREELTENKIQIATIKGELQLIEKLIATEKSEPKYFVSHTPTRELSSSPKAFRSREKSARAQSVVKAEPQRTSKKEPLQIITGSTLKPKPLEEPLPVDRELFPENELTPLRGQKTISFSENTKSMTDESSDNGPFETESDVSICTFKCNYRRARYLMIKQKNL
jgi:hypothetical protein